MSPLAVLCVCLNSLLDPAAGVLLAGNLSLCLVELSNFKCTHSLSCQAIANDSVDLRASFCIMSL